MVQEAPRCALRPSTHPVELTRTHSGFTRHDVPLSAGRISMLGSLILSTDPSLGSPISPSPPLAHRRFGTNDGLQSASEETPAKC